MAGLVKHYQNSMQGIPQLGNTWGSMIRLLDAVLVNGFNHVPILGLTKANAESITATINLGSSHGFIDRQVVRIAGSTNGWDGDYKVLSADSTSITVECTATHASAILGTATCFTAPLDFEIVHQTPAESTTPKRAYRSTNTESLGLILLVHDFCSSGANASGAKFAKVGIVSSMSDIDTITGIQMPYSEANPQRNWTFSGGMHGWAKWYYRVQNTNASVQDSVAPPNTNAAFNMVGNDETFFIDCLVGGSTGYALSGVAEFHDPHLNAKNIALFASGIITPRAETWYYQAHSQGAYLKSISDGHASTQVSANIFFNKDGLNIPEPLTKNMTIAAASQSDSILVDAVVFDNNNNPRGVIPFVKNHVSTTSKITYLQDAGKTVFRYISDQYATLQYALTLENE